MTQLRDSALEQVEHAIDCAIMALDDWSALSFPEHYAAERVAIAKAHTHEHGLGYYIASILEELRAARKLL